MGPNEFPLAQQCGAPSLQILKSGSWRVIAVRLKILEYGTDPSCFDVSDTPRQDRAFARICTTSNPSDVLPSHLASRTFSRRASLKRSKG